MGSIIDLIKDLISITGNNVVDGVLIFFIGLISFSIAFGMVGMIFDVFGKYDSNLMSDMHWGLRFVVFIALTYGFIKLFAFINWLFSFKWWIYLIVILILLGIIFLVFYLKFKFSEKKNIEKNYIEEIKRDESNKKILEPKQKLIYNRDICPRCGARLVKRHGPFGDFYGCSNYTSKNCKYTRKFK